MSSVMADLMESSATMPVKPNGPSVSYHHHQLPTEVRNPPHLAITCPNRFKPLPVLRNELVLNRKRKASPRSNNSRTNKRFKRCDTPLYFTSHQSSPFRRIWLRSHPNKDNQSQFTRMTLPVAATVLPNSLQTPYCESENGESVSDYRYPPSVSSGTSDYKDCKPETPEVIPQEPDPMVDLPLSLVNKGSESSITTGEQDHVKTDIESVTSSAHFADSTGTFTNAVEPPPATCSVAIQAFESDVEMTEDSSDVSEGSRESVTHLQEILDAIDEREDSIDNSMEAINHETPENSAVIKEDKNEPDSPSTSHKSLESYKTTYPSSTLNQQEHKSPSSTSNCESEQTPSTAEDTNMDLEYDVLHDNDPNELQEASKDPDAEDTNMDLEYDVLHDNDPNELQEASKDPDAEEGTVNEQSSGNVEQSRAYWDVITLFAIALIAP